MCKSAFLSAPRPDLKRLLLYEAEQGTYLFGYNTLADEGCLWDLWFATAADAEAAAQQRYHVGPADWQRLPDPLPGCQHDWIAPVRVIGHAQGQPQRGQLEKLVDGQWVPLRHTS